MRATTKFGSIVVIFLAGVAIAFLAWPLIRHAGVLATHLRSGSWVVAGGDRSIDAFLGRKYGQDAAAWSIQLVSEPLTVYPLDDKQRRQTILKLGNLTSTGAEKFLPGELPLSERYRQLLDAASQEGGAKLTSLGDARFAYDEYAVDRGLDFPAFDISTDPDATSLSDWDEHADWLMQSGKCVGSLTPRRENGDALEPIMAVPISIRPRVLDVKLLRPWLDWRFYSDASRVQSPSRVFDAFSPLRQVPRSLIVRLSDGIEIGPLSADQARTVRNWRAQGSCCQAQCEDIELSLVPGTIVLTQDRKLMAVRFAGPPMLYAVVVGHMK